MKDASLEVLKDRIGDDDTSIKRNYNWFKLEYGEANRKLISFSLNDKKVFNAKRAAGFFANTTLEAHEAYGFRDEQEKYFNQMKGQMGFDRQRNWLEEGKTGRPFILFVALIISSYVRHVWKSTVLKDKFGSTLDVLDEMRSIRYIEYKGKFRHITPFVGDQVDICKAFGIDIPDGCAPLYRSRKVPEKRRGRPKKPATVKLES